MRRHDRKEEKLKPSVPRYTPSRKRDRKKAPKEHDDLNKQVREKRNDRRRQKREQNEKLQREIRERQISNKKR
jgi:hypothetical protein